MARHDAEGGQALLDPSDSDRSPIQVTRIDFSNTPLSQDYSDHFALVIDNLLTPAECSALQAFAGNEWQALSKGESFRECQRILTFDPEWPSALYDRIAAHLPEEAKVLRKGDKLAETIVGAPQLKASMGARKTVRSGNSDEKSFLTCQLYLNDAPGNKDAEPSGGGETRFWASQVGKRRKVQEDDNTAKSSNAGAYLDIKPKLGRALVFQQRMLWHSGQEIKQGEKFTVRLDLMYERHLEKY
ncbi:hypothetical protein F5Y15DRAFT_416952 [Xylariaceae sp. FL0016]|nr:hypothetical protein F5Y15DRAFT_416952 [Xylariaceae sp. FL0016]